MGHPGWDGVKKVKGPPGSLRQVDLRVVVRTSTLVGEVIERLDGLLGDQPRVPISPDRLDLFGIRSIDPPEKQLVRDRAHVGDSDTAIAPGVGTTVPGGATYREAHLIMEMLHDSELVRSADIVELNPFLDERGRTARVAVELIGSLFGLQITDRPTPSNAVFPDNM